MKREIAKIGTKRRQALLLRTFASVLLTLLGLLLATFLIARVVPIDPVLAVVGDRASAETYARARGELGLDRPLYVQFYRYLLLVLHGDFGRSVLTRNPVVDDIARFTDERTIVTCAGNEFGENLEVLRRTAFRIVTLPMPEPVLFAGQRLPASYANFYIANGLVLVPTFNDPKDRIALNTLAELFPDREVVGIGASDLVLGLGTLHCMTQQQPD